MQQVTTPSLATVTRSDRVNQASLNRAELVVVSHINSRKGSMTALSDEQLKAEFIKRKGITQCPAAINYGITWMQKSFGDLQQVSSQMGFGNYRRKNAEKKREKG